MTILKFIYSAVAFVIKAVVIMQKRKETSFTFRSHVWDRGKSVGITVRFLLGAWIIILFVVSVGSVLNAFFFL